MFLLHVLQQAAAFEQITWRLNDDGTLTEGGGCTGGRRFCGACRLDGVGAGVLLADC